MHTLDPVFVRITDPSESDPPHTSDTKSEDFPYAGMISEEEARKLLIRMREQEIQIEFKHSPRNQNILRRSMISALITYKPKSQEDFFDLLPEYLVEKTDMDEIDFYLERIISITSRIL